MELINKRIIQQILSKGYIGNEDLEQPTEVENTFLIRGRIYLDECHKEKI